MARYRKRQVVVDAIKYERERNIFDVQNFFGEKNGDVFFYNPDDNEYYIKTLEGNMKLSTGDYIIKGVKGEFYPCKPDVFEQTYEAVEETA